MFRLTWYFFVGCCSVVFTMTSLGSAWADDSTSNPWKFTVAPYVWAFGMNGDVGVAGRTIRVDDSFIDIMQDSDSLVAFMGNFLVNKGPWTFYVAPTWAKVGTDDESIGPLNFDVTETIAFVGFGLMYRLMDRSLADVPGGSPEWANQRITFDLLAGGRYTNLNIETEFKGPLPTVDRTQEWVDPIIGGVTNMTLTDKLSVRVRADVGGFGVGTDFTGHTVVLIGYKVHPFGLDGTFLAGYRALYQDYSDGSGLRKFTWDMWLHGPVVGLAIDFTPFN